MPLRKSKNPARAKKCVGELCWNPEKEQLEFTLDKKCPVELKDKLEAKTKMVFKES